MSDVRGQVDYDKIKEKIKAIIDANEFKVVLIDSAGNVVSDISLSALRDALKGANDKDFSTLEDDVEAILAKLDVALSTRASEDTLSSILGKLDVALSTLAKLQRWGRNVEPSWVHGDEVTAPAADTKLASTTVSTGKKGYIYGFFISAGEANDFRINWTSEGATKSIRIPFSGKGALQYVDITPLNEGLPADEGTEISITNVNAGGTGVVYQARLFIVEV